MPTQRFEPHPLAGSWEAWRFVEGAAKEDPAVLRAAVRQNWEVAKEALRGDVLPSDAELSAILKED